MSAIETYLQDHPEYQPIEVLVPESCANVYHAASDSLLHVVVDSEAKLIEVYQYDNATESWN